MNQIDEMLKIFNELKQDNIKQVNIDNLIKFTENFKEDKSEQKKQDLALLQESLRAQNESDLEMFRSVISYGQASLKYGVLLCGSAAIAVLTFMGNTVDKHPEWIKSCSDSLLCFTSGAFIIGICVFMTYLTQYFYAKKRNKLGNIFCYGTWTAGVLALVTAISGCVIFYGIF